MDWKLWIVFFLLGNSTGMFIGAKYITNEVNKIGKQKVKRGTGTFTNGIYNSKRQHKRNRRLKRRNKRSNNKG